MLGGRANAETREAERLRLLQEERIVPVEKIVYREVPVPVDKVMHLCSVSVGEFWSQPAVLCAHVELGKREEVVGQ